MAILMLEQAASLHQVKDAPFSRAIKDTMPSCPQCFFEFFQKFRQLCRDQSHEREGFLWKLELEKSEDDSLHEMASRLFVQSSYANAPAATARILASTSLVSGFHSIPFLEHSSDHSGSGPKEEFARLKPKLSQEPLEDPRAANEWLSLAVRRGQAL
jgi:hypothetical protein